MKETPKGLYESVQSQCSDGQILLLQDSSTLMTPKVENDNFLDQSPHGAIMLLPDSAALKDIGNLVLSLMNERKVSDKRSYIHRYESLITRSGILLFCSLESVSTSMLFSLMTTFPLAQQRCLYVLLPCRSLRTKFSSMDCLLDRVKRNLKSFMFRSLQLSKTCPKCKVLIPQPVSGCLI